MNNRPGRISAPGPDQLGDLIGVALERADQLGLSHVAIHLDAALVCLTGKGVEPPQRDWCYDG